MSRDFKGFSSRPRGLFLALIVCLSTFGMASADEQIEVAPGVKVTKHTYPVPINEQPFYGFQPKNQAEQDADRKLLEATKSMGPLEKIADHLETRGWQAFASQNYVVAAQRFNQAWLLAPGRSVTVHGFAALAQERFKDTAFAEELMELAAKLKNPLPSLPGDHGRLMLIAGKPKQAVPLLEAALISAPGWLMPKVNLGWARLALGERAEACRLAEDVLQELQKRSENERKSLEGQIGQLKVAGKC